MFARYLNLLGRATTRPSALLVVLVCALLLPSAHAAPISVLTLDASRIGTQANDNGSINWNFATGEGFGGVRNALLDPSKFGPSGVVGRGVTIGATSAFNSHTMGGTDVILLSALYNFSFEDCEFCVIESFVRQGGGLFVFANSAAERFAAMVGAIAGLSHPSGARVSNADSPLAKGPFGDLAVGTEIKTGFLYLFDSLGAYGTPALSLRDRDDIMGASFTLGQGRVVLINDEELFFNGPSVNGLGSAQLSTESLTLFLNSFAYVTPNETFRYVAEDCGCEPIPEPASPALLFLGLVTLGIMRWLRIRRAVCGTGA